MPLMFDGVMNGPKKLSDADAAFEMIVKARPVFPVTDDANDGCCDRHFTQ